MKKKKQRIPGMMMRPASSTEEENQKVWESSEFYTEANFMSEFRKHLVALDHVAECAKIFILKNWKNVKDWSKLDVVISDNSGKLSEYYNYVKRPSTKKLSSKRSSVLDELLNSLDEENKKKHNPIHTVEGVVLDPTDGDFSLTINGKDHLWIDKESIITIANYIEEQIKDERGRERKDD
jgi:hypothetical protein